QLERLADNNEHAAEGLYPENAETAARLKRVAQMAAIKYYTLLKRQYPTLCQRADAEMSVSGEVCVEDVLYYLGYEYERAGMLDQARKAYLDLVQSRRDDHATFVPYAYLAFGELFLEEARRDSSRWKLAIQSFQEVLKNPAPQNDIYAYALLRLG